MKLRVTHTASYYPLNSNEVCYEVHLFAVNSKGERFSNQPIQVYPENAAAFSFWKIGNEYPIAGLEGVEK